MRGDCSKARFCAREPPSRSGPPSPNAGSCHRDDRTQPALARLGERESRAECPSRVRAESLDKGTGSQRPKRKDTPRWKEAQAVRGAKTPGRVWDSVPRANRHGSGPPSTRRSSPSPKHLPPMLLHRLHIRPMPLLRRTNNPPPAQRPQVRRDIPRAGEASTWKSRRIASVAASKGQ